MPDVVNWRRWINVCGFNPATLALVRCATRCAAKRPRVISACRALPMAPCPDGPTGRVNAKTPPCWGGVSGHAGEPDDYLLSHGQSALSSAWSRFTVLFGMGRGGTDSLWSSGMTCCRVAFRGATANLEEVVSGDAHQGKALGVVLFEAQHR